MISGAAQLYVRPMNMDPKIEIWNLLHDGEFTAIEGEQSTTLRMFVSIAYLRKRLKPLGDSFVLTLTGLKRLEWHNFDGSVSSFREELDIGTPEILKTDSQTLPVTIETTMGSLILEFDAIRFNLDTGEEVSFETIVRVCEEYWTEWERKAEQGRGHVR